MTTLNWNHLRIFAAIVENGGLTRAAQVLGMSQSAVSQTLQRLETAIDRTLVRREGRSFSLTPVGEAVLADVQAMQVAAERIGLRVGQHRPELRVMTVSNLISPLLDEAFRLFHQRHPDVLLRVEVRNSHDIVATLREQAQGLGICLLTEPGSHRLGVAYTGRNQWFGAAALDVVVPAGGLAELDYRDPGTGATAVLQARPHPAGMAVTR